MADLIANPETFIEAALAEGKKRNITGYMMDFEAPSPYGDQALGVMAFINLFTDVMHANGIQVSNCIGSLSSLGYIASIENATLNRVVPMGLYGGFNTNWLQEVQIWRDKGMANKLGVGFCPTCGTAGAPADTPDEIASKFAVADIVGAQEIDMFAFGGGYDKAFEPYWAAMKRFIS